MRYRVMLVSQSVHVCISVTTKQQVYSDTWGAFFYAIPRWTAAIKWTLNTTFMGSLASALHCKSNRMVVNNVKLSIKWQPVFAGDYTWKPNHLPHKLSSLQDSLLFSLSRAMFYNNGKSSLNAHVYYDYKVSEKISFV